MLNEADNMIQFPERYSLGEMYNMGNELEDFAEDLEERREEFEEVFGMIKDLIDKCVSKATILRTFHGDGIEVIEKL